MLYTETGAVHDDWMRYKNYSTEMVHEVEFAKLQPHVDKIMEKLKPDIVVTDFCFHPAVLAADKFGIPVVLNV